MRLAIVEDDGMLRENLKLLLSGEPGIDVVGAFGCAGEALEGFRVCAPEIALVDIGLPDWSGVDLIAKVKEEMPALEIMAHTIYEDRETVFAAIKAGACGYLLKGTSPREIVESLYSLYNGGAPMSPRIARKVVGELQVTGASEQYLLTRREKEILKLVETGLLYKEIADKLSISPHTVHSHIKKIYEKLQAKNRKEALAKAKRGFII